MTYFRAFRIVHIRQKGLIQEFNLCSFSLPLSLSTRTRWTKNEPGGSEGEGVLAVNLLPTSLLWGCDKASEEFVFFTHNIIPLTISMFLVFNIEAFTV